MFKHYEKLTNEEVESLIELSKDVKFKDSKGSRMRVGANAPKVLSVYNYSKWFEWKHKQRELFKTAFPEVVLPKVLQGWFLEIPAGDGLLDLMNIWVGKPHSGRIVATALKDQVIFLDNKEVRLQKGEQIGFSLCTLHEIKPSTEGQLWACVMFHGCHTEIHG